MDTPSEDRYLALKAVMMPRDTNPYGTIFGGVTLSYIDQAAVVGARHAIRRAGWPEQPLVTVAMDRIEFHHPVFVGDVVSFLTKVVRVGRTSITEAQVTYVAVKLDGDTRKPVPIRGE